MTVDAVRQKWFLGVVVLSVALLVSRPSFAQKVASTVYEDISFAVAPSATRAYVYGTWHFDVSNPGMYDIARASALFEKAHTLDPAVPFLQHQRARVAFLEGSYRVALERIDQEIAANPQSMSSYYVRGLVKGFVGDYKGATEDYEVYLHTDPTNWAAINDYAWVLLKDTRPLDALAAVDWGLNHWPDNPWLLNSKATAHFELGQLELAKEAAELAAVAVENVSERDWLQAYPGNDPLIAAQGIEAFRTAVRNNMHSISLALESTQK
jgi:tetratricopeptide (TPR) repeat protein